ncbi:MAG: PQQ-binding-like beta-propeller repeat protein [Saprospiraceae bacterium]|nr:PQQ-binding-like beta-propeller repeat protein [Saprospiraceae bacterium]
MFEKRLLILTLPFFIMVILCSSCSQKKTELTWNQSLYNVGAQSSPRTSDLNQDGILDIIIGAGKEELGPVTNGVMALDGATGQLLWEQAANAHMVGSATFYDVNEDGVNDIFIGGRNHNLKALNGKTGAVLWEYELPDTTDPVLQFARFNFYNSVLVPDLTGDGRPELLTVNGGNWDASPGSTEDRFPGVLMLLDVKDGTIIAADTMPDGKESYMSPLYIPGKDGMEDRIVFGTGGETISGQLYLVKLSALAQSDLSSAQPLLEEEGHGFIAPPALVDLNQDNVLDIIAISHAGTISAIDGQSQAILWQQAFQGLESSNAPAIGNFNEKEGLDVLATLCEGVWPAYSVSMQFVLDGETGEINYRDTLGCYALSSPVIYDLDGDGIDEAIFSTNHYDCGMKFTEDLRSPPEIENQVVAVDFKRNAYRPIDRTVGFRNIYSTPWLGDLDDDGYLDLVYIQNFNPNDLTKFLGMSMKRISTAVRMKETPIWGSYMGQSGNGLVPLQ